MNFIKSLCDSGMAQGRKQIGCPAKGLLLSQSTPIRSPAGEMRICTIDDSDLSHGTLVPGSCQQRDFRNPDHCLISAVALLGFEPRLIDPGRCHRFPGPLLQSAFPASGLGVLEALDQFSFHHPLPPLVLFYPNPQHFASEFIPLRHGVFPVPVFRFWKCNCG